MASDDKALFEEFLAWKRANEGATASVPAPAKATATKSLPAGVKARRGCKRVERVEGAMQYGIGAAKLWFAGKDGKVRHCALATAHDAKARFVDAAKAQAFDECFTVA